METPETTSEPSPPTSSPSYRGSNTPTGSPRMPPEAPRCPCWSGVAISALPWLSVAPRGSVGVVQARRSGVAAGVAAAMLAT